MSLTTLYFKLDRHKNVTLDNITSNLKKINKPGEVIEIDSFALSSLFDNDLQNYLMYWSLCEVIRENTVLWIISPKEISINEAQVRIIYILVQKYCHEHKNLNIFKIKQFIMWRTCRKRSIVFAILHQYIIYR